MPMSVAAMPDEEWESPRVRARVPSSTHVIIDLDHYFPRITYYICSLSSSLSSTLLSNIMIMIIIINSMTHSLRLNAHTQPIMHTTQQNATRICINYLLFVFILCFEFSLLVLSYLSYCVFVNFLHISRRQSIFAKLIIISHIYPHMGISFSFHLLRLNRWEFQLLLVRNGVNLPATTRVPRN